MNELEHGIPKQERILAVVKTPRRFVEVGRKMLCADLMPCAHDAALKQRQSKILHSFV